MFGKALRTNENLWVFQNLEEKIPELTAVMWKDMQWTCSVHSVSFLLTPPEFPELSLRRFIFNEWRKQEQMFPMKNSCSFSVCTALSGVRQGWEEAHHWRWFGGWVQSTVHSTTEWIWMDSHTKPWYAWYATRLITFTLCKRANSKFPCVRKGQLRKVCLLCCFPWLSAFRFQPVSFPDPTQAFWIKCLLNKLSCPGY